MRKIGLFCVLACLNFVSCLNDNLEVIESELVSDVEKTEQSDLENFNTDMNSSSFFQKGVIYVKLKKQVVKSYSTDSRAAMTLCAAPTSIKSSLQSVKAQNFERLIAATPKINKSLEYKGLNRWYKLEINKTQNIDSTICELKKNPLFEVVEPVLKPVLFSKRKAFSGHSHLNSFVKTARRDVEFPVNDEFLNKQWHYHNTGNVDRFVEGCDINLFEAWKIETGKPNVIVGVVDGGIYYEHEDLAQNMWINTAEVPDNGIDDDGNGYVDDIYGWNCCNNSGDIYADEGKDYWGNAIVQGHGTHVAGTIGAVNNNELGVCGIAGGDGSVDSGIRLMSCMIFGKLDDNEGDLSQAYQYARENGAVILNNSWGYVYDPKYSSFYPKEVPEHISDCIENFIKYAGCDDLGNQLPDSPMKGGLIVFAYGNDGLDLKSIPACHPDVVSVTSIGPNWLKASYSNYGEWADIAAPGGEFYYSQNQGEVYSTLPYTTGERYGYMAGTSMACPHVTGVAALICSKFGGPGFTADELKARLLSSIYRNDINSLNPPYSNKLGVGFVNAAEGFAENNNIAPEPVEKISSETGVNYVDLSWNASLDEDDEVASGYLIELSQKSEVYDCKCLTNVGDVVEYRIEDLLPSTTYDLSIVAYDRWGNKSEPLHASFRTTDNKAPIISEIPEMSLRVNANLKKEFRLKITDPEGFKLKVFLEGDATGVSISKDKEDYLVRLNANGKIGKHRCSVVAEDNFGKQSRRDFEFEVYKYQKPSLSKNLLKDRIIPFSGVVSTSSEYIINLSELFQYDTEFENKVSFELSNNEVVDVNVLDDYKISINPKTLGSVVLRVKIKDGITGGVSTARLNLYVVDDLKAPVLSALQLSNNLFKIVFNPDVKDADVYVRSLSGVEVLHHKYEKMEDSLSFKMYISSLSPGQYTLVVKTDLGSMNKTFLKL